MSVTHRAIIIRTTGEKEAVEFDAKTSYETLRDAVGGLIECIRLRSMGVDMWCNDEGKMIGLEQNPIASGLWADEYGVTDIIVGDVIVTGGADVRGNTVGLTDHQFNQIMAADRWIEML